MKKLSTIITLSLCIAACGTGGGTSKVGETLDSLQKIIAKQDTAINHVFNYLDTIMVNLQGIKAGEQVISSAIARGDMRTSSMNAVACVDTLLLENKRLIAGMTARLEELRYANMRIEGLEKLIAHLTEQTASNYASIIDMKRQLEERYTELRALHGEMENLTQDNLRLESEVQSINVGYYVEGTQKQLIREGIIVKGGFMGLNVAINENHSLDAFVKMDIRTLDHIQIDGRNPELLSTHPGGSYEFTCDASGVLWLNILDRKKFWETTRILVICYK